MLASGVKRENIVIETVPGSYELPMACARYVASSAFGFVLRGGGRRRVVCSEVQSQARKDMEGFSKC